MNATTLNDAVGNLLDMHETDPSSKDAIQSMLSTDALFCGDTERGEIFQVLEASSSVGAKRDLQKVSTSSCAGSRFSPLMLTEDEECLTLENEVSSEDRQTRRQKCSGPCTGLVRKDFSATEDPVV